MFLMAYLRLILCALSAFLVGCASYPAANSYYEAPAYVSSQPTYSSGSAITAYEPAAVTTPIYSSVAENGSYYGQPNVNGVPKTVAVNGYYLARTARMSAVITEAPLVLTRLRPAVES